MEWLTLIGVSFLAIILIAGRKSHKKVDQQELSAGDIQLLENHVTYYRALNTEGKKRFQKEVLEFMLATTIEGVKTEVEPLDRIFMQEPVVAKSSLRRKTGRNEACYCGSGKKYKFCHGKIN